MAGNIKGIIVEIGGDTSGLQNALSKVNSATSSLSKELRGVNSLLKLDPSGTELVAQKQTILKKSIEETSEKLKLLKETQQKADDAIANGTKVSDENYRNLQREIINTENKLKNLQVQASKWTTAGKAIEEVGTKIENIGSKVDSLGNKLTTRVTAPLIALGVVGVQSAAKQEAAMQQVDKIYGDAADTIKNFAENTAISFNMSTSEAYKYAQIYGNLIQSITDDQAENAQYTQELLEASSVIASATGRTMEDVMDRIRSGLLGNTEAIEDLGVNVNVAMIESTDAFKKFAGDKSWKQLDFQTQQQIRLFAILEQTTKKYGKEVNKNTASDIQKLTAKFKNLTGELSKKLLPIADKLIDKADKFLDKIGDLTDEEQENIIKTGIMVAAAGPLVKILGTTTSVVGGVTKGIGTFNQAIAVATNKTTSNVTSVNNLAKAFTALTSPTGLLIAGLTAAAAATIYFTTKQTEAQKVAEELAEKSENLKQTYDEFNQSIDDTTNSEISQINAVSRLKDELKTLVDENGKVKNGYESRVDFILNELNKALGTEYELNGDIIDSYKELQNEIDKTIEKKKAEIILSSEEKKYAEAIETEKTAVEELKNLTEKLGMSYEEAKKKVNDYYSAQRKMLGYGEKLTDDESTIIKEYTDKEIKALDDLVQAYGNTENVLQGSINNQKQYMNDYELFSEGKYNEIGKTITKTMKDCTNVSLQELNNNILLQKTNLDTYKTMYQQYGSEVALELQKQAETNLETLASELIKRTSTIQELGEDEKTAWKNLASSSYSIYSEYVSKLAPEMQDKIQEATGVVIANTPEFAEQAGKMGKKVTSEFDKNGQAKEEALKTLQGYYEGLNDKEKNELLKKTVGKKAEEVAKQFEKGDYETSGKNVLEGIYNGLNNRSLGQSLINKAAGIARSIANQFNIQWDEHSPSKLMEQKAEYLLQPIGTVFSKREKNLIKEARNLAKNIVKGFDSSFILNDKLFTPNAKTFNALNTNVIDKTRTIFTTPTLNIYTQGEVNIRKIADEVNRIFGSQY